MNDEAFRNVAASNMAHDFIIEILLAAYIKSAPPGIQQNVVDTILQVGKRTDHFVGIAKDDETAELFADVTIRMHEFLQEIVDRAVLRINAGKNVRPGEVRQ